MNARPANLSNRAPAFRRAMALVLVIVLVAAAPQMRSTVERSFNYGTGFVELSFADPEAVADGVTPGTEIAVEIANRYDTRRVFHVTVNGTAFQELPLSAGQLEVITVTAPHMRLGERLEIAIDELDQPLVVRIR